MPVVRRESGIEHRLDPWKSRDSVKGKVEGRERELSSRGAPVSAICRSLLAVPSIRQPEHGGFRGSPMTEVSGSRPPQCPNRSISTYTET